VDVYSYGIVLWQVFTAACPFEGVSRDLFMANVVEGGARPDIEELDNAIVIAPSEFLRTMCSELKDIITSCWDADYSKRPDMKDLTPILTKMYFDFAHGAGEPEGCCSVM
jgi:hypothetical protein